MKKKVLSVAVIVILLALIVCIILYFRPLTFSVSEDSELNVILNTFVVIYDKPDIEVAKYKDITAEQKQEILALFAQYPYTRTLTTPFSDGSMDGIGTQQLSLYAFSEIGESTTIHLTSSGQIVVDSKNYKMENAQQLIDQIIDVLTK